MGGEWVEESLGDVINIKHGFAFKGEFFRDEPRRPREKVDPDRLRPARDGVRGVLRTGHPADLDAEHPGNASRRL